MVCCKNNFGAPPGGDDERHLPRLTKQEKAKRPKKTVTKKKCKRGDIEAQRVVVAAAAERAERGGRGSGIRIGDQLSLA
jgi:hypothetical protein